MVDAIRKHPFALGEPYSVGTTGYDFASLGVVLRLETG